MEFWENCNYNVGHDEMIEDKYNADLLGFMSRFGIVTEPNITMVYTPVNSDNINIENSSYNIVSGCYNVYPMNQINICSNS